MEVRTITGLITKRPIDNSWVVEVTQYHTLVTREVCSLILWVLCQGLILVAHTVRLDITFIADIDTILIAEVVPKWRVWIVASTNSVDIQLLHNLNILNHILTSYVVACVWRHLVTVCTLNVYRHTIYEQLCIFNLNLTETDLECSSLNGLALIKHLNGECIQSWNLCTPRLYLVKMPAALNLTLGHRQNLLLNLLTARSVEGQTNLLNTLSGCNIQVEVALGVVVVQVCNELHIFEVLLIASVDIAVTTNTRQTEEVLVLQV